MSPAPLSFFTIDRGTATTAVSLIAPCGGRFRLLAAGAGPAGADLDALLEDLVRRVEATDASLLPDLEGWREWARLVSLTQVAPRVVCAAPSERALAPLVRTFASGGWEIAGRIVAGRTDPLTANDLVLDPAVDALALGAGEPPTTDERVALPRLAVMLGALAGRRPDLAVLLCGASGGWDEGLAEERLVRLPAPADGPAAADSPLRVALRGLPRILLDARDAGPGRPVGEQQLPDGRTGLCVAVATLAGLLDRRVEAVEVGHSAGSRILAHPGGVAAQLVSTDGALVPARALRDEREIEAIARWSALRSDPFSLFDRFRNLAISPWRDAAGDGPRLRLAALRAALARLDAAWRSSVATEIAAVNPDLLMCSGGAFAAVPPAAAALAVVDAMRRPGAVTLFHDHARVLAPLGTLPDESDRRRLLADLLDDALLPLGSAIVAGEIRPGTRSGATLRVTSSLQAHELELAPGALRLVDLPPGVPARVELETREGSLLGVRSRKLALELTGGLGGLLVDTREIPLRLPDRAERRRVQLETWEAEVWAAVDG